MVRTFSSLCSRPLNPWIVVRMRPGPGRRRDRRRGRRPDVLQVVKARQPDFRGPHERRFAPVPENDPPVLEEAAPGHRPLPAEGVDAGPSSSRPQGPDQGVVPVEDGRIGLDLGEDELLLGREIVLEGPVPVQVVQGDVEERRDPDLEVPDGIELEARDLGDVDVVVPAPVRERDERRPDIPGRERPEAGVLEDPVGQGRRRGFAVRSRDPDDPSP